MEKPIKVRLHVLSPVHIGCDDVYEPTSFVIDAKKEKLIAFDPMKFIKSMSVQDRDALSKKCMNDNLLDIFKFIKNKYRLTGSEREVMICKGLSEHYEKVLKLSSFNKDMVINKFTIERTAYNLNNSLPYVPGTSLKGALRTAYLSWLASTKKVSKGWTKYLIHNDLRDDQSIYFAIGKKKVAKQMEANLLQGDFDTDPFRMVKVADMLPVDYFETKIIYAKNRKKKLSDKPTKAENITQIMEVIQSGTVFEGIINIHQPIQKDAILNPIDASFLKLVNDFYVRELNKEKDVVKEIGAAHIDISKFSAKLGESAFLVRIGRHSGAEAATIEENRHIKIMQKDGTPPKYLDHATTIWFAAETNKPPTNSSLMPFGWAVLEIMDLDIENIYPKSIFASKKTATAKEEMALTPPTAPNPIIWDNTFLTWNPGTKILTATLNSKKAELQLGDDKTIVPQIMHKKLFEKREAVKAKATMEPVGNAFKIIKIETP